MLLVFVPNITNRILYTFELCFNKIVNLDYQLTDNFSEFENSILPKFYYSNLANNKYIGLLADNLLFANNIIKNPDVEIINNIPCFFPQKNNDFLKFDFFATVFWYVTRMEEYNFNNSERFLANNSYCNKFNLIEIPIVNIWTDLFLEKLTSIYPEIKYSKKTFNFQATIDVDSAFKYKYKSFSRNCYWFLRDLLKRDFQTFKKRFRCICNKEPDIWNCFDKINLLHQKYNCKAIYFFLVGKRSNYDKNISTKKPAMKNIICNLQQQGYEIGLHSSWLGTKEKNVWAKEKNILESIINKKVTKIRQHYIFIKFPYNFREYLNLEITEDYSLIYPDKIGFRLGTTQSIPFFDLEKNEITKLMLFPSVIMDVSLKNYQKKTIEESKEIIDKIIFYYKKYGGTLISLWHNESLSGDATWKDWECVYEYLLGKATNY